MPQQESALLSRWRQAVVDMSSSKMHSALGTEPVLLLPTAAATSRYMAWLGQSCAQVHVLQQLEGLAVRSPCVRLPGPCSGAAC